MKASVIGGGLAGSEAAFVLAEKGIDVVLYEMRPEVQTPAHHTGYLAELVCSNSLRASAPENAAGLLKEELREMRSLVMESADRNRVPAGGALAVDREAFSAYITDRISSHPRIKIKRRKVTEIPESDAVIIATGPLTEQEFSRVIREKLGKQYLYFFDAAAPLVKGETIDMEKAWWGSRYEKGTPDYINCPLDREEYYELVEFLCSARRHVSKIKEEQKYFEGCMPVEEMARRGPLTLAYGPLKPVGLIDPATGKRPFAAIQLRIDNRERSLFNMVGFQTSLARPEQRKMLSFIPALRNAEIVRYGMMHRNSYINSPAVLEQTGQLKNEPDIFFAGQITGVEGYIESIASGLVAGINCALFLAGKKPVVFPQETAVGALMHYIVTADENHFQPVNITWGLFPPPEKKIKNKLQRKQYMSYRALEKLRQWKKEAEVNHGSE